MAHDGVTAERQQWYAFALHIWRTMKPRSAERADQLKRLRQWRQHVDHRMRPGYVEQTDEDRERLQKEIRKPYTALALGFQGDDLVSVRTVSRAESRVSSDYLRASVTGFTVRRLVCLPRPQQGRAPRGGRRVTARSSARGSPRKSDDGPEPDPALVCPRCGSTVAVLRGVKTCSTCWVRAVCDLADRGRARPPSSTRGKMRHRSSSSSRARSLA